MVCTHTHTPLTTTKKAPLYTTHTHIYKNTDFVGQNFWSNQENQIDWHSNHSFGDHHNRSTLSKNSKKKKFFLIFFFVYNFINFNIKKFINQSINQ